MNAYCEFAREMEPYYAQWIALDGRILSRIHRPVNGYLMNELHDEDGLHQHFDQLMKLPADVLDEIEVSPVPSKAPVSLPPQPGCWISNGKKTLCVLRI